MIKKIFIVSLTLLLLTGCARNIFTHKVNINNKKVKQELKELLYIIEPLKNGYLYEPLKGIVECTYYIEIEKGKSIKEASMITLDTLSSYTLKLLNNDNRKI